MLARMPPSVGSLAGEACRCRCALPCRTNRRLEAIKRAQFGASDRNVILSMRQHSFHSVDWMALLLLVLVLVDANGIESTQTTHSKPSQLKPWQTDALQTSSKHQQDYPSFHHVRRKRWSLLAPAESANGARKLDKAARGSPGQAPIPAANFNFEAAFQGECGKNNKSNPCEHICLDLHDGTYECSCFYGFTLAVDGYSCAQLLITRPKQDLLALDDNKAPATSWTTSTTTGAALEATQVHESARLPAPVPFGRPEVGDSKVTGAATDEQGDQDDHRELLAARLADNGITGAPATADDNRKLAKSAKLNSNEIGADNRLLESAASGSGRARGNGRSGRQRRLLGAADSKSRWFLDKIPFAARDSPSGPTARQQAAARATSAATATAANNKAASELDKPPGKPLAEHRFNQSQSSNDDDDKWQIVTYQSAGAKTTFGGANPPQTTAPPKSKEPKADELDIGLAPVEEGLLEAAAATEEDPGIRSIMLANDRLVAQLAMLVGGAERIVVETEGSKPIQLDYPHYLDPDLAATNDNRAEAAATNDDDDDIADEKPDYELGQLEELVQKTIADYTSHRFGSLEAPKLSANADASNGDETNGASASGNVELLIEQNKVADSSSKLILPVSDRARRSQASPETNANALDHQDWPDLADQMCSRSPLEGADEVPVFRKCTELPECESGGQCVLELVYSGETDEGNTLTDNRLDQVERARCRCPVGRGGHLCQKPIQRVTPRFMGRSYLALPMISDPALTSLRLVFRPQASGPVQVQVQNFDYPSFDNDLVQQQQQLQRQSGASQLLLYSQKFLLLLDDMSRIELRYLDGGKAWPVESSDRLMRTSSSGKITRVIGSRDVERDKWNELIVTDASSDSQINSHIAGLTRIVLVTPDKIDLRLDGSAQGNYDNGERSTESINSSELFVAGMPDALRAEGHDKLNQAAAGILGEKLANGFRGCIRELSINSHDYNFKSDFNGDTLDGIDIGECCR